RDAAETTDQGRAIQNDRPGGPAGGCRRRSKSGNHRPTPPALPVVMYFSAERAVFLLLNITPVLTVSRSNLPTAVFRLSSPWHRPVATAGGNGRRGNVALFPGNPAAQGVRLKRPDTDR